MSVLDRAIVKAYQRRHASQAASQTVAADRRALEQPATPPVEVLPQPLELPVADAASVDVSAASIRAETTRVEATDHQPDLTPLAIPSTPAQRPTYIASRDIPAASPPEVRETTPSAPAVPDRSQPPELVTPIATISVPLPIPTLVDDQKIEHNWKWPEICQQLDQFTGDGFRQLAKHLQFAAEQGHKVLGFVSSARNAGRTSVLMTLTRILALEGKTEALLIDADRRHPQLGELSGYDAINGLGELLHGQCRLPQAVMPMTPGRISLLPLTETVGEAEWQTLVSPLRALLKQVRRDYDMVLIDVGVMGTDTKLADCWLRGGVDAVITISRQLTGKRTEHEVLNWKQIGIESLGVIETFA